MRPAKRWLITDTHWNDPDIVNYCNRPENFGELIVKNCRKVVAPQDIVIHLGDVIFDRAGELDKYLSKIPGTKIMVRGNHDNRPDNWYITKGFAFVCDSLVLGDVVLSHIPLEKFSDGVRINIHGHFHNLDFRKNDPKVASYYNPILHKLLAMEYTNYCPVDLVDFSRNEQ